MSQKPPTLNAVVAKHNSLLPKLAKMELSELRLLSYCLAHYDSRPGHEAAQGYYTHTATVQDLAEIFPGMGKHTAYAVVRQAVKSINSKPFEEVIFDERGTAEVVFYWFSGFKYYREKGRFEFSLSPAIIDLALSLDGDFTRYRLAHVYQFKSALTWKLYELLKQWVTIGRWEVSLDELRVSLGISSKYPAWRDFKKRIIDNPIKEINELSDIHVKYEKKKRVRAVSGIVFFINSKEKEDDSLVAVIGDENSDMQRLMHHGVTKAQAEIISRLAKEEGRDFGPSLEKVIARYEAKSPEERGAKGAYIFSALKDEFTPKLFDTIDTDQSARKLTAYQQQKQSQEKNKYFKDATSCKHFNARERGEDCQSINLRTKKCQVCNQIVKK